MAVVLHVGIGACLGMWTFGLIMLVGCAIFLPERTFSTSDRPFIKSPPPSQRKPFESRRKRLLLQISPKALRPPLERLNPREQLKFLEKRRFLRLMGQRPPPDLAGPLAPRFVASSYAELASTIWKSLPRMTFRTSLSVGPSAAAATTACLAERS